MESWRRRLTFGGSFVRNARLGDLTREFVDKMLVSGTFPTECRANFPQECPARAFPTRVSCKSVTPQECHEIRVFHKSVPQECLLQECPVGVAKRVPDKSSYSQMLKSWRHSNIEAFTWGFESMEVVAMLRLVGEKTRQQQRQTKRRSSKTPIAQASEWGGRWGNK